MLPAVNHLFILVRHIIPGIVCFFKPLITVTFIFSCFLYILEFCLSIAITIGVRILGPAAGFILGSFCTRIYVNPTINPGFGPTDPQWVGAWWLGKLK